MGANRVAPESITGTHVREETLGKVPRAAQVDSVRTASVQVPLGSLRSIQFTPFILTVSCYEDGLGSVRADVELGATVDNTAVVADFGDNQDSDLDFAEPDLLVGSAEGGLMGRIGFSALAPNRLYNATGYVRTPAGPGTTNDVCDGGITLFE